MDKNSIFEMIKKEILNIISEREEVEDAVNIEPHHSLTKDIGLNSLELAKLVAKLEIILDVELFTSEEVSMVDIHTVEDLCHAFVKVRG